MVDSDSSSSSGSYSSYEYSSDDDSSYDSAESPKKTRTDDSPVLLNPMVDDSREQLNETPKNRVETGESRTQTASDASRVFENKDASQNTDKGLIDEGIVLGSSDMGCEEEGCIEIEAFDISDARGGIKLTSSLVGVGSFSETSTNPGKNIERKIIRFYES